MINESKTMILITVFVITLSLLSGCAKSEPIVPKPTVQVPTDPDPVKQRLLNAVFKVANIRDYEGLSVSVYWMHPEVIREFSYKLDDLIKKPDKFIKLEGDEIEGKLDLFGQIKAEDIELAPGKIRTETPMFYLVIESTEEGKLYDFLLWGNYKYFIVNGTYIEPNQKFLDIIMPLLNYDARLDIRGYGEWF
ncbi:MAG: hypothetical protein ACOYKC_08750 [Anaerolineaceae bacterium]|jgi:hypothetical protein